MKDKFPFFFTIFVDDLFDNSFSVQYILTIRIRK